jgi:hypothetical protein
MCSPLPVSGLEKHLRPAPESRATQKSGLGRDSLNWPFVQKSFYTGQRLVGMLVRVALPESIQEGSSGDRLVRLLISRSKVT